MDEFGLAQSIGDKCGLERGGTARRRLDREQSSCWPDFARERHGPLSETGADIDYNGAGQHKTKRRRMHMRRVEQSVAAAGVERARHMHEVAAAVQNQAAGPLVLQPREQALFAPAPD